MLVEVFLVPFAWFLILDESERNFVAGKLGALLKVKQGRGSARSVSKGTR